MRKQVITISLLIVALTIMFLIMSCGRADQNQNTGVSNTTRGDPCDETDIIKLEDALRKAINKGIKDDNDLSNHNAVNHNSNTEQHKPYFRYELVKVPGTSGNSVYVYFEGRISGKDVMEDVVKVVEKYVKKKCAFRVFFVPEGTLPLSEEQQKDSRLIKGFEWTGCQFPMVACPDGECRESCDHLLNNE